MITEQEGVRYAFEQDGVSTTFIDALTGSQRDFILIHTADIVAPPGVPSVESVGIVVETAAEHVAYFLQQIRPLSSLDQRLYYPHASLEHVVEKWRRLLLGGLAVPQEFLYNVDGNTLLRSEMTEGGERIIADKHFPLPKLGISLDRGEVLDRYKESALKAVEAGVVLGKDAFALSLIRGSHVYEACHLDLGRDSFLLEDIGGRSARLEALVGAENAAKQVFGESIEYSS